MVEHALSRGDKVAATARKPEQLDDLKARYSEERLRVIVLDVTNKAAIVRAFAEARTAFGRIDIVLNNAALSMLGEAEGIPEEDARLLFDTNFWGAVNVSREAVRVFREENPPSHGGRLLSVSSFLGTMAVAGMAHYSAAKAGPCYTWFSHEGILKSVPGLEAFTQALNGEIDPRWNIKVSRMTS